MIPQVILQTLLSKAEEKLKDGEQVLKEHENIDSTMAVSKAILLCKGNTDSDESLDGSHLVLTCILGDNISINTKSGLFLN